MALHTLEMEGTWEEIIAHAAELAGRRVRVTVLPAHPETGPEKPVVSPTNQRMLDLLADWEQSPLTDEERAVLDGLEENLAVLRGPCVRVDTGRA